MSQWRVYRKHGLGGVHSPANMRIIIYDDDPTNLTTAIHNKISIYVHSVSRSRKSKDENRWIEEERRDLHARRATEYNKNVIYPETAAFAPALAAFAFVPVIAPARSELLSTQARRTLSSAKRKKIEYKNSERDPKNHLLCPEILIVVLLLLIVIHLLLLLAPLRLQHIHSILIELIDVLFIRGHIGDHLI